MSPSGIDTYSKHATIVNSRRSSGGSGEAIKYFGIEDGQTARIRFLEQGENLTYALTHRLKNKFGGFNDVLCLDQEDEGTNCPACHSDIEGVRPRSTKGFLNVIWRGTDESEYARGPVYKMNDKGYPEKDPNNPKKKIIVGFEDSVFLWKCSKTVWEMVIAKEKTYRGIMSRDFVVSREGASKENTKYAIEPAVVDGGPEAMTIADQSLAGSKFDVVKLTTPGTYDEMVQLLSGQNPSGDGSRGTFQKEIPSQENVFNSGSPMRSSAFQR